MFLLPCTIAALVTALITSALMLAYPSMTAQAQAVNPNCTLIVPAQPLTAQGLATPYQLVATDPAQGPCREANINQAAFVQSAVWNPADSQISVYNPLVIDKGTQPAIAPVVPNIPKGAIVALWFGFNGTNLTLQGTNNSLQQGNCINGLPGSIFGQFAYCNAPQFFAAVNKAIDADKLNPPPLGRGKDGLTCPSTRDFSVVDQDQSDNTTTRYLVTKDGRIAQDTAANFAKLQAGNMLAPMARINASDNELLVASIDPALGCTPWMVPDLANPGKKATALPLNEIQAAIFQPAPMALVPAGDPMVKVGNKLNLNKLNLFRVGVNQPPVKNLDQANTTNYCISLVDIAPARLLIDSRFTLAAPSPLPAVANNLFTFLANRFNATWGAAGLNCQALLHQNSPIVVTTDKQGVAIAATINGINPAAAR